MRCEAWNEAWIAHLYGELDPETSNELGRHLDGCAACRGEMERLSATRQWIGENLPPLPVAPRMVLAVPARPARLGWAFASGIVAASLVFGLGVLAATRWADADADPPDTAARVEPQDPRPVAEAGELARVDEFVRGLEQRLQELEQREAPASNAASSETLVTRAEFERNLARFASGLERQRREDLQFVIHSLGDTELRTGTWMNQANEAMRYLAVQQDPRLRVR